MSELNDVTEKVFSINLLGKDRALKFGMKAFARIEECFGGIEEMSLALTKKPFTNIPKVIYFAMAKGNDDITEENIADLLDEGHDMNELKDILTSAMNAAFSKKEGTQENPPKAE